MCPAETLESGEDRCCRGVQEQIHQLFAGAGELGEFATAGSVVIHDKGIVLLIQTEAPVWRAEDQWQDFDPDADVAVEVVGRSAGTHYVFVLGSGNAGGRARPTAPGDFIPAERGILVVDEAGEAAAEVQRQILPHFVLDRRGGGDEGYVGKRVLLEVAIAGERRDGGGPRGVCDAMSWARR